MKTESDKGNSAECIVGWGNLSTKEMSEEAHVEFKRLKDYNFDRRSFTNGHNSGAMWMYGLALFEIEKLKSSASELCDAVFDRMSEEEVRDETRVRLLQRYKAMRKMLNAELTGSSDKARFGQESGCEEGGK